jgi:hypothetical protein
MKTRARDIRTLQRQHNKERWRDLYEQPASIEDQQGDEAWRDAIAGQHDETPASVDAAGTYTD